MDDQMKALLEQMCAPEPRREQFGPPRLAIMSLHYAAYVKNRKLFEYNSRNGRRMFAEHNRKRIEQLETQYPAFRETYERLNP